MPGDGALGERVIAIKGLAETNAAFRRIDKKLPLVVRGALKEAAKPAADRAHGYALARIRNIGDRWSQMRIGATASSVYLVPFARRRRGSKRPNLSDLLIDQAMLPAVDEEYPHIVERMEFALDELTSDFD